MLVIDPNAFNDAVEHLMIAARMVSDESGSRVMADTPRRTRTAPLGPNNDAIAALLAASTDWRRVRAITLGAIVALTNGAARIGDEETTTMRSIAGAGAA